MSRRTIAALAGLAVLAVTGVALGLALGGHGSTSTHGTNGTTTPSASAPAQVTLANRFAVSGATAYACAPGFSSVGGQRGAQVVFTNASGAAVQVYWLDFSGAKKLYVRLKPGASQRIKTYVGDYWLISDATGGCMGIFGVNGAGHITVDKT